jgi:transposase
MTLRPHPLPPIPEATVAAVQAAFPKGNLYMALRTELGTLYDDQLFAELYPPAGRPVEVAPWRLALVMVMQDIEGLTDRQAADAVRLTSPCCTIFASGYSRMTPPSGCWIRS